MIIDCHGHYTTTPPGVGTYREEQKQMIIEGNARRVFSRLKIEE